MKNKKKIVGKLTLNKETLASLTDEGMNQVKGGLLPADYGGYGTAGDCGSYSCAVSCYGDTCKECSEGCATPYMCLLTQQYICNTVA